MRIAYQVHYIYSFAFVWNKMIKSFQPWNLYGWQMNHELCIKAKYKRGWNSNQPALFNKRVWCKNQKPVIVTKFQLRSYTSGVSQLKIVINNCGYYFCYCMIEEICQIWNSKFWSLLTLYHYAISCKVGNKFVGRRVDRAHIYCLTVKGIKSEVIVYPKKRVRINC